MSLLIPVGIVLCIVLIVATAVGSLRTTDLERAQREQARAQREERRVGRRAGRDAAR